MAIHLRTLMAFLVLACACAAQEQKFVSIGDLPLTSGEVLLDCRVGYRTLGELDAAGANAVLVPSWYGGTTRELVGQVGPGRVFDCPGAYVILVDALADGVSTSPSNSVRQPRMRFPRISVRDMVESQRRMLKALGIGHLRAVMGISMGGMQTFQWLVSYPEFLDRAVPILASPRLAPYDLLLWRTMNLAITGDAGWHGGDYAENPARAVRAGLSNLTLGTPAQVNAGATRAQVDADLARYARDPAFDACDQVRQGEAMIGLDVAEGFGGSMEKAAAAVKAQVLVVVAASDQTVTPGPALEFAGLLKARTLTLEGAFGHRSLRVESANVGSAVRAFMAGH